MDYLPTLKSVGRNNAAAGGKSNRQAGRAMPLAGFLRPFLFFILAFVVLSSAFWALSGDIPVSCLAALFLAGAGTIFALITIGHYSLSDLFRGGNGKLPPHETNVAFDLLSALVDSMPAHFLVKDREHRYILINKTMREWFGWESGEVLGKTFEEISLNRDYTEQGKSIREQDEFILQSGETAERFFEVERADGTMAKLLSRRFPIHCAQGTIVGVAAINVDVTELKETQRNYAEVLRERDRQAAIFRSFFEALPFPAAMKETDGRFINVNSQLVKWNTFPTKEVVGKRLDEIVGADRAKDSLELDMKVLEAHEPAEMERTFSYNDGSTRTMRVIRFPMLDNEGGMLGLGLFNIDVTAQRAAERLLKEANADLESTVSMRTAELEATNSELTRALEELRATTDILIESDRMASLGSMVAGMAHEINTPIGVGVTAASLVRDKVEQLSEEVENGTLTRDGMASAMSVIDEASDVMLRNMARADSLIRSLKQVAVDQTNMETRTVDLEHYTREVELSIAPVLSRAGIKIDLNTRPGLMVNLQPGPLAQVLTNILMNVVHHAYPGGEGGRILIETDLDEDGVAIRVQDFGVGMDPETLGQVFVPFFTTRRNKGGTGLGLSIVYNVVRTILGGDIAGASKPGEGTIFTVTLPRSCHVVSEG